MLKIYALLSNKGDNMKTALILSMTVLTFSSTNNYEDLLNKASNAYDAQDFKSAFTHSQEILKINPNDPFAHYYIAQTSCATL